jgi:hypothetical protein
MRRVGFRVQLRSGMCWIRALGDTGDSESAMDRKSRSKLRRNLHVRHVYNLGRIGSFAVGGGDQGDFGEESIHPKPPARLINQTRPKIDDMVKKSITKVGGSAARGVGTSSEPQMAKEEVHGGIKDNLNEESKDYRLEPCVAPRLVNHIPPQSLS